MKSCFSFIIMSFWLLPSVRSFGAAAMTAARRPTWTRHFSSIDIYNEQDDLPDIHEKSLQNTISNIRDLLGYSGHSIQVILVDDEVMQERNLQTRGMDKPTDVLSFPFLESNKPGILEPPQFDIPEYYNLGDVIVDVPYVMRSCQEDYDYFQGNDESDDDSDVYDDDDRGVSGAMAHVHDAEKRIHMLMVHGMLHLVGYDHIEDEDYELMVAKEEEILAKLGFMMKKEET